GFVEDEVSFANLAERPVDSFPDKVTFISGFPDYGGKEGLERRVARFSVVDGQHCLEAEPGPLLVLRGTGGPLFRLSYCEGRFDDEVSASLVHHIPGIKGLDPGLQLVLRHPLWVIDHGSE